MLSLREYNTSITKKNICIHVEYTLPFYTHLGIKTKQNVENLKLLKLVLHRSHIIQKKKQSSPRRYLHPSIVFDFLQYFWPI